MPKNENDRALFEAYLNASQNAFPKDAPKPEQASISDKELFEASVRSLTRSKTVLEKDAPLPLRDTMKNNRSKRALKRLQIRASIDLHGFTQRDALAKLAVFLSRAYQTQTSPTLVIHGKGAEGVLKRAVETYLKSNGAYVAEWTEAPKRLGGSGAKIVWIKRQSAGE